MINHSISVSCPVKIKQEKIWEIISTPGFVNYYHPFCKDNPVLVWDGEKSVDEIVYENDLVYRREFVKWYDNTGYDLLIIYKDKVLADAIWRINEIDNGEFELRITLKLRLNTILHKIPRFIRWIPYYLLIRWQMRKYLVHVLRGFDSYITTGVKTEPNQFGSHRFYSKK